VTMWTVEGTWGTCVDVAWNSD